jgi:hypothetical protein
MRRARGGDFARPPGSRPSSAVVDVVARLGADQVSLLVLVRSAAVQSCEKGHRRGAAFGPKAGLRLQHPLYADVVANGTVTLALARGCWRWRGAASRGRPAASGSSWRLAPPRSTLLAASARRVPPDLELANGWVGPHDAGGGVMRRSILSRRSTGGATMTSRRAHRVADLSPPVGSSARGACTWLSRSSGAQRPRQRRPGSRRNQ